MTGDSSACKGSPKRLQYVVESFCPTLLREGVGECQGPPWVRTSTAGTLGSLGAVRSSFPAGDCGDQAGIPHSQGCQGDGLGNRGGGRLAGTGNEERGTHRNTRRLP